MQLVLPARLADDVAPGIRAWAVWTGAVGRPISVVQRARLCARAAITVQALLAA